MKITELRLRDMLVSNPAIPAGGAGGVAAGMSAVMQRRSGQLLGQLRPGML